MEWMYSPTVLSLFLLFKLALLVSSSSSKCQQGSGQDSPCRPEHYCLARSKRYSCERCTKLCLAGHHLVEIKKCEKYTNRLCHCDKGFYCPDHLDYTCIVPCKPCPSGKFSDKTSLKEPCRSHTNCERIGLVTVSNGTATQDSVCDPPDPSSPEPLSGSVDTSPVTRNSPDVSRSSPDVSGSSRDVTLSSPDVSRSSRGVSRSSRDVTHSSSDVSGSSRDVAQSSSDVSGSSRDVMRSSPDVTQTTQQHSTQDCNNETVTMLNSPETAVTPHPAGASTSPAANRASILRNTSSSNTSSPTTVQVISSAPHSEGSLNYPWMVALMLLLAVCVLACCFVWPMGKTLKKQLGLTHGLPFGKYQVAKKAVGGSNIHVSQQQHEADVEANPYLEPLMPQSRGSAAARPHAGQGSMQHVTLDNRGKGERINNTVGSIFIYSPGMVVLGTNASKPGEEVRQEAEEVQHLASVPQQESRGCFSSSSDQDSVGLSTQEEDDDKELSYPIPASSK